MVKYTFQKFIGGFKKYKGGTININILDNVLNKRQKKTSLMGIDRYVKLLTDLKITKINSILDNYDNNFIKVIKIIMYIHNDKNKVINYILMEKNIKESINNLNNSLNILGCKFTLVDDFTETDIISFLNDL